MADLPSEQKLAQLSWYALAAYATRCARRAQSLYVTTNQSARDGLEHVIAAEEAFVQGTGNGYTASGLFSSTRFLDLPFEMAPAVYTAFGAAQVCSDAASNLSFDGTTITAKAFRRRPSASEPTNALPSPQGQNRAPRRSRNTWPRQRQKPGPSPG
jgi:hypothetical protein